VLPHKHMRQIGFSVYAIGTPNPTADPFTNAVSSADGVAAGSTSPGSAAAALPATDSKRTKHA